MSNKKDTSTQSTDNSKKGLMNSITRRRMVISSTTLAGLTAAGVAGTARIHRTPGSKSRRCFN